MSRPTLDELRAGFLDPPRTAAPMVRWWWFGPSVERAELYRELTAMAAAGFGGVEVAFVYPLGPATTTFLSDSFLADLRFAAERARDLGLRFHLTLGSGWSFGGPHISDELAARRLRWDGREVGPEARDVPVVSPWPGDELVGAYLGAGSAQEQPDDYVPLPIGDGRIEIPAGSGPRHVLLAYAGRTGQNVKRAALGAEGPVLDHYAVAAVTAHLRAVGDRLLDAVPADLVDSVFCDSLEVYGADWTPDLPAEFERRCGYPLLSVLPRLVVDGPEAERLRADYHRTLSRLYEENFVAVVQRWAAERGVAFRIQGYGAPPATISSYRFADRFEGEGWGWLGLPQTRWASSAAHLYGQDVVSSEVWTWVHSPSFRATPLDLLGEAHDHLLNGVNQLVGHGWPYSPRDVPGLGWMFYAAGAIDDRNPWWPAMPELNASLTRLCWLLRQGAPVAEVAVYVSNEDLFSHLGVAQGGSLDAWREARRRIGGTIPATIRTAGLDYDLIDEDALAFIAADRYPVVVVPATSRVSAETGEWFERVREAGGTIVLAGSEVVLPDAARTEPSGLRAALTDAVVPDLELTPAGRDVGVVHRRVGSVDVYLLVNTGPQRRTFALRTRRRGAGYEEWDARTGQLRRAGSDPDGLPIALHPYDATVLVLTEEPTRDRRARIPEVGGAELPIGSWRVRLADEAPVPVEMPHVWEEDPARRHFSGSATYEAVLELEQLHPGARVVIDFGDGWPEDQERPEPAALLGPSYRAQLRAPVGEVAEIRVNGMDCGVVWAPPYRCEISTAVRPGVNRIEIIVSNTAANALAADPEIIRLAAESERHYGRRFRMQDLDKAMATVRSGLLRAPVLRVRRG